MRGMPPLRNSDLPQNTKYQLLQEGINSFSRTIIDTKSPIGCRKTKSHNNFSRFHVTKKGKTRHIDKRTTKGMTTERFMDEVKAMRPTLLSVARGILGSDEEAEDVVQDAMLRLWQLRDEPIMNVRGFARVVVRNLALSKVRRKRETVDIGRADIAYDDETDSARNELIDRMMTLVDALPTMQQTVLRMRHMQEMTMADIASIIGTSEVAVRQSLSRARRSIIEQFKSKSK